MIYKVNNRYYDTDRATFLDANDPLLHKYIRTGKQVIDLPDIEALKVTLRSLGYEVGECLLDDEELTKAKQAFLKQAAKVDRKFVSSLGFTVPFSRRFIALAQLIAEHYDELHQKFKKVEFLGHELTKGQAKVLAMEYVYNCYILENNLQMYHEVINSGKARTKIDLSLMDFK